MILFGRVERSATLNVLIDLDRGEIVDAKASERRLERTVIILNLAFLDYG